MKKIRIVFLILIILLITGCAGTYNLRIDEDLSVKEELSVTIADKEENHLMLERLLSNEVDNKDDYSISNEGDNIKVDYKHEYSSIEEYLLESDLYKQLFDNVSYNTDDKEFSLSTSNILNLTNSNLNNAYDIKSLQINVITPLKVIEENADLTSENTYSWTLNQKTREKYMYITINKSAKLNRGTTIVLVVLVVAIALTAIIIVKRLSESKKI